MFTTVLEHKVSTNRVVTLKRNYETNQYLVLFTTAEIARRKRTIIYKEEHHKLFRQAKESFEKIKRGEYMQVEIKNMIKKRDKAKKELEYFNTFDYLVDDARLLKGGFSNESEYIKEKIKELEKDVERYDGEILILKRTGDKHDKNF